MSKRTALMLAALIANGHKGRIGIINDGRLVDAESLEPIKSKSEFDALIVTEEADSAKFEELFQKLEENQPGLDRSSVIVRTAKTHPANDMRKANSDYIARQIDRELGGKITREEALQIERQNARQRLKWAEEARIGRAMVEAAETKRERRRQRNLRLQESKK